MQPFLCWGGTVVDGEVGKKLRIVHWGRRVPKGSRKSVRIAGLPIMENLCFVKVCDQTETMKLCIVIFLIFYVYFFITKFRISIVSISSITIFSMMFFTQVG